MSPDMETWNARNVMLNALEFAIEQKTDGRLSELSIEFFDNRVVVEACSTTFYAVQLALTAIRSFVVDSPQMCPSRLTFHVNGHPVVLHNPYSTLSNGRTTARDEPPFLSGRLFSDLHDYEPSSSTRPQPVIAAGAS